MHTIDEKRYREAVEAIARAKGVTPEALEFNLQRMAAQRAKPAAVQPYNPAPLEFIPRAGVWAVTDAKAGTTIYAVMDATGKVATCAVHGSVQEPKTWETMQKPRGPWRQLATWEQVLKPDVYAIPDARMGMTVYVTTTMQGLSICAVS